MTRVQRGAIILLLLAGLLAAFVFFHEELLPNRAAPAPQVSTAAPASPPAPAPAAPSEVKLPPAQAPKKRAALVLTPAVVREAPPAGGGVLAGRVVSFSSGQGVVGAELTFSSAAGTWSVVSKQDGTFAFTPPAEGAYDLVSALADGYLPFAPAWGHTPIRFFGRAGLRIEGALVTLVPAIRYTGLVLDPDGRPVAGAGVQLVFPEEANPTLAPIQERYESGPDGAFTFSAPDDTLVRANHPDYAPAWGRVDFKVQVSKRLTLTLGLGADAPAGTIVGRVEDADGAPVTGAQVVARRSAADPFDPVQGHGHMAISDPAGAFELTHLPGGAFKVAASLKGYAPAWAEGVTVGTRDLVLTMGSAYQGRIVGTARAAGAPVPAFTVLVNRRTGPLGEGRVTQSSIFDPQGHYAIEGLEAGDYRVRAVAFGQAPSAPVDVNLPDPPVGDVRADLELSQGGKLVGTVVSDPSGAPLAGARVSTEGPFGDGAALLPISATATTDDAGRFELAGLSTGLRSVTAAAAGHNARIVSALRIQAGQVHGPVTIALTALKEGEEPKIELAGIGVGIRVEGEALVIGRLIEGGGALEAGLVVGDAILAVEGTPITELGFDGAIQLIRGPAGTPVQLTLRRLDGQTVVMAVFRRVIESP